MSAFESNDTSEGNSVTPDYEIGRPLRFWLFLIFDVFAVLCTVLVLCHLLTKRSLRQTLANHTLILILLFAFIYEVIDIPLHLQFLYTGVVRPATPALCLIWWFIDWSFFFIIAVLLLFTSIERHILIFHSQMVATRRKRLLIHYIPLFLTVFFMITFYIIAIFTPICENTYDYTSDLCGSTACYETVPFFAMLEQMGFSTVTSCLIVVFNILLFARVIWQKYRIHQPVEWRKQRKLAIQVISMSMLYLVFSLPLTIIYLVRLFGPPDWAAEVISGFFFLTYFTILLLPFVCLLSLPNLYNTVKKLYPLLRRRRRVGTITAQ